MATCLYSRRLKRTWSAMCICYCAQAVLLCTKGFGEHRLTFNHHVRGLCAHHTVCLKGVVHIALPFRNVFFVRGLCAPHARCLE